MFSVIPLCIRRSGDELEFAFPSRTSFVTLFVTTADGKEEVWRIKPIGMSPKLVNGAFVAVAEADIDPTEMAESASIFAATQQQDYPSSDRVVYGRAPEGYVEVAPARPLVRGERYAVMVMSARSYAAEEFTA